MEKKILFDEERASLDTCFTVRNIYKQEIKCILELQERHHREQFEEDHIRIDRIITKALDEGDDTPTVIWLNEYNLESSPLKEYIANFEHRIFSQCRQCRKETTDEMLGQIVKLKFTKMVRGTIHIQTTKELFVDSVAFWKRNGRPNGLDVF